MAAENPTKVVMLEFAKLIRANQPANLKNTVDNLLDKLREFHEGQITQAVVDEYAQRARQSIVTHTHKSIVYTQFADKGTPLQIAACEFTGRMACTDPEKWLNSLGEPLKSALAQIAQSDKCRDAIGDPQKMLQLIQSEV